MPTGSGQFIRDVLHRRDGAMAVVFAVNISVMMAFGALVLDVGYLYSNRARLQVTADAAALAAAAELPNVAPAQAAALDFATKNMPTGAYGDVLAAADIETGNWDGAVRVFTTDGNPRNAVRVVTRRSTAGGNAFEPFLAGILGVRNFQITTAAIAIGKPSAAGFCEGSSVAIMAGNQLTFGQDTHLADGVCVCGRLGVDFGQDAVLDPGSSVGTMSPESDDPIEFGQDSQVPPNALHYEEDELSEPLDVAAMIDDVAAGIGLDGEPHWYNVYTVSSLPDALLSNSAYIVNDSISIDQDYSTSDVIIAARGSISWGQDGAITNSNGDCAGGSIGIIAENNISLGQDAVLTARMPSPATTPVSVRTCRRSERL